jgi:tetratricopeptide (TPR) repeat protein
MLLQRSGRLSDAAAAYEQLLARWPDDPEGWYNLAVLQRQTRRFDAALASYQQALDRGVSRPEEVHLNRGVIYSDFLRQDDAALRELRRALALNPDYVPALANLANLESDLGQRDAALATYEKILAIDPGYHEALARYANLKAVSGPDDPLVARLRQALAAPSVALGGQDEPRLRARQRARQLRRLRPAFEAYSAANRHSRESAPAGAVLYEPRRQEALVDELIATFRGAPLDGRRARTARAARSSSAACSARARP